MMNQQQSSNYQGNYQGNNFNNFNNQPPLSELIPIKANIMEGLSRKLASNDKILENINNRMDVTPWVLAHTIALALHSMSIYISHLCINHEHHT
jgi:hypothetical protein